MKRQVAVLIFILILLITGGGYGYAEEPKNEDQFEKEDQFVYGVQCWNGGEYSGSFIPEQIDTVYLIAGKDNVLSPRETKVYFWPLKGEYMADWSEKNEPVTGELEILENGELVQALSMQTYSFYYPEGPYSSRQELLIGEDAKAKFAEYQKAVEQFLQEMQAYYEAEMEYRRKMDQILEEVKESGKKYSPDELPEQPERPQPPQIFVQEPRQAFIINLPPGEYTVRLRGEDGARAESEKRLVVFAARRHGLGYMLRPEDKWTKPVNFYDQDQSLYIEGSQVFFLQAYDVAEYNAHHYARMITPVKPGAGMGMQTSHAWVAISPERKDIKLQVLQGGKIMREIARRPYYVKQVPGQSLGYEILDWDPEKEETQNRSPSFYGFKVNLPPGNYQLRAVDESGQVIPGSVRDIRTVSNPANLWWWGLIPLGVGLIVLAVRRMRASGGRRQQTIDA